MKICFLLAEHPFLDARIFHKEAKSLVRAGYDVTMIVPKRRGYLFNIDGQLFKNRFLNPRFTYEGVQIVTYEDQSTHQLGRQLYYMKQSTIDRDQNPLIRLGIEIKADLYHAHEFTSCYDALMIKRALKKDGMHTRVIYDSHELVPDPLDPHLSQKQKRQMYELLNEMCKELDAVITVSPSIQATFKQVNPRILTMVLYNSPPLSVWKEEPVDLDRPLTIGYVGRMETNKGSLSKLINIIKKANEDMNLHAKIIGGSTKNFLIEESDEVYKKIDVIGWIPYHQLAAELETVDVGWIDVEVIKSANRNVSLPNKLFTYLERGIAPLVNKSYEISRFIQMNQCGFVINKETATAEDYATKLIALDKQRGELKLAGARGRKVLEEKYSWEQMEQKLIDLYELLLKNPPSV